MPNGTQGRIYGGDPSFIHLKDGTREKVGHKVAQFLTWEMLMNTTSSVERLSKPLCPGCYMVALFNAAKLLAEQNGQSLVELGNTMSEAFKSLAAGHYSPEEICVILDPEE